MFISLLIYVPNGIIIRLEMVLIFKASYFNYKIYQIWK